MIVFFVVVLFYVANLILVSELANKIRVFLTQKRKINT